MTDVLVVADDLTGALDTGAQLAGRGLPTVVGWEPEPPPQAAVWVVDTESRDLAPALAAERVHRAAGALAPQVPHLYKKVDSTLRGNVGPELEALLEASGAGQAVLAPAFPAQGRTTVGARVCVHGSPLDGPAIPALFGQAAGCIDLQVVRQGVEALAAALRSRAEPVLVIDAMEERDLATIAQAAVQAGLGRLLAGSAGLAAHLGPAWGLGHSRPAPPLGPLPAPVLIVAGTRHAGLSGQLAHLRARAPVAVVGQVLGGMLPGGDALVAERARALAAALGAGRDAVLTTQSEPLLAGGDQVVAALLARIVLATLEEVRPGALVLTGGSVAMAVCQALGARAIAVEGELEPGIPQARILGGLAEGMVLVTKAGGFGDDGCLARIVARLRAQSAAGSAEPGER